MPVNPTFPGVYIEEISSGVHTIVGVSTAVGATIDYFPRGPVDHAIQVFSFADVEREFGGLDTLSEASYTLQQFFLNGGGEAWVIRSLAAGSFATAEITLDAPGGGASVTLRAGRRITGVSVDDPGIWGNFVRADVDYNTIDPATLFNLTVSEVSQAGTQPVLRTETYRNLSMTAGSPAFVQDVVNETSQMVQVSAPAANRPAQTGTVGAVLVPGAVHTALQPGGAPFRFNLIIDAETPVVLTLAGPLSISVLPPQAPLAARGLLENAIRAAALGDRRLENATVELIGNQYRVLLARSGATPGAAFNPSSLVTFTEGPGTTGAALGLVGAGVEVNVQQYSLGGAAAGAQTAPTPGTNGNRPLAGDLIGVRANKTGIFALEDVDLFNILCIPRAADLADPEPFATYSAAEAYCLERRAFLIVDTPLLVDTVPEIKDYLNQNATLRTRNAALYFPRIRIPDPLNNFRLRDIGVSGTLAGVYARTDGARGVWKAPAGIEATLRNVQELSYSLTDPENGTLNPLGINALRNFPVYGIVSWGARTLDGADVQASEWKYIPVRRFALFLEESLYRGTKWVVFEPNDEPLWSQIRLNIGAFLQTLFRQGAFQGQTPREAYFVKCDKETTTQNDINLGIVNILVGFAPLKPAEFVIIKISQIAGQIQV